jgi:glycine hydroxymethyltransferase
MTNNYKNLKKTDAQMWQLVTAEVKRQQDFLTLIASENYASPAVLEALGSPLNNKYSEGYPGKRYYPGNELVDKIEILAGTRAKKLFKAEHANVQALSGGPANLAIYSALLKPGDKLMGAKLAHGGHLSHGHKVNFSGQLYSQVGYELDANGRFDMKKIAALAKKAKPKLIVAGFSAYSRDIDWAGFRKIANSVKAYLLADISHTAGLVAAGQLKSPVKYADVVMFTTHKSFWGPRGAVILCKKELAEVIDRAVFPGFQGGPHDNAIAAIAVALKEAATPKFKNYAKQVVANAKTLAAELTKLDYKIISGGTDNHLMVVDLTNKNLTGKEAEQKLAAKGILVSRSTIPNDPRGPFNPSGIRLGTYAVTTRGFKPADIKKLAKRIDKILSHTT